MRQAFIIEPTEDEEITLSAVKKSGTVRLDVEDADGDQTQVDLTIKQAKELRSALDKAITVGDIPLSSYYMGYYDLTFNGFDYARYMTDYTSRYATPYRFTTGV